MNFPHEYGVLRDRCSCISVISGHDEECDRESRKRRTKWVKTTRNGEKLLAKEKELSISLKLSEIGAEFL